MAEYFLAGSLHRLKKVVNMAGEEQLVNIQQLAPYWGWILVILIFVVFALFAAGVYYMYRTGKLVFRWPLRYLVFENRHGRLQPTFTGKARAYMYGGKDFYQLQVGFMKTLQFVPALNYENITPNNWALFYMPNRSEFHAITLHLTEKMGLKLGSMEAADKIIRKHIKPSDLIVPLKLKAGSMEGEVMTTAAKQAYMDSRKMLQDRFTQRSFFLTWILPIIVLGLVVVGIIGALYIAVSPTVQAVEIQASIASSNERIAAIQYKIAQKLNISMNETETPVVTPVPPPGG